MLLKLYDLQIIDGKCYGIVRINLSEVSDFIVKCETDPRLQTITTSGKIRLVRERLEDARHVSLSVWQGEPGGGVARFASVTRQSGCGAPSWYRALGVITG